MNNVPGVCQKPIFGSREGKERRRRERLKLSVAVHVRPVLVSERNEPEDITSTLDLNRHGLCFITLFDHYWVGMVLFVTVPYSVTSVPKRYLAEIVRIDHFPNGSLAVAVRFLT